MESRCAGSSGCRYFVAVGGWISMCVVWGCVGVAKGDCLRARPKEPYHLHLKTITTNIICRYIS